MNNPVYCNFNWFSSAHNHVFPRIGGGVRPAVYVRAKKDIMAGQEVGEIKDPIVLSIKY